MRLKLLPFQEEASAQVIDTISSRIKAYNATRDDAHPLKTAFALTSVTGSGKTVIASSVIEALLRGSTEFATQPIENLTVLWLSYDPALCTQTRNVFATNADEIHPTRLKVIDSESFNENKLAPGHVYFLSLPLLGGTNRLTRTTDTRNFTFWDVLDKTVKDRHTNLLVVVDEAHVGMGTSDSKSKSLLESVISGDDKSNYSGAPLVWGISATPERFQKKIKKLLPESSGGDVVVKPADVQASGLLKQSINLYTPDESASMHLTMLGQGVDELIRSTRDWRDYCLASGVPASDLVVPLMVAQLANRSAKGDDDTASPSSLKREDEMIKEVVRAAKARIPGFSSKNIAHVIADRGTITVGDIEIEKIDPVAVQGRSSVQILIAKDAVSTGWDCPRAEVLVSMRPFSDATAITQMLGRMVRTPLARITGVDRLDRVSCWVPFFTTQTVQHVVDVLTGQIDPDTGDDKPSMQVAVNPRRLSLGGVPEDKPVERVVEVRDAELAMDSDDVRFDVSTEDQAILHRHLDELVAQGDDVDIAMIEVVTDMLDGKIDMHAPIEDVELMESPSMEDFVDESMIAHTDTHTHTESESESESESDETSNSDAGVLAECIEAITVLPSQSIPVSRVVPIKRLLDVVSLLSVHGGEADVDAGKKAIERLVRRLDAEAIIHADAVAAARKNIITSEQRVTTATFDGVQAREMSIVVEGGLDMVRYEFDQADRLLSGMAKEYYRIKFMQIDESGEDPNEFELKADAAALAHVPEIVEALNIEATAYADELIRLRSDAIALMALAVQDKMEALRLASRVPQPKKIVLSDTKTYTGRGAKDALLLPKHIYCDEDGMWPVPTSIVKNTWEMAVLRRETSRDETQAWYRNPSANSKDSLSIAYQTADETWRTFQPDFLVVERAHDGMKVAIVDPHWMADAEGLARLKAFAKYVEDHRDLLTRANPIAQAPGGKELLRLSLTRPEVREAVRRASSVSAVFASHGEAYPLN